MQSRIHLIIALWALAAGCTGGSGSSGFDISPDLENRNIGTAVGEQRCVTEDTLTICPAGAAFDQVPPIPSGEPGREEVQLTVRTAPVNLDTCRAEQSCDVPVHLDTQGIPESALYQLAVRQGDTGPWQLRRSIGSIDSASGFNGSVEVSSVESPIQLAVLVYLESEPAAPGETETLHATGAELVFVDAAVRVIPAQ